MILINHYIYVSAEMQVPMPNYHTLMCGIVFNGSMCVN